MNHGLKYPRHTINEDITPNFCFSTKEDWHQSERKHMRPCQHLQLPLLPAHRSDRASRQSPAAPREETKEKGSRGQLLRPGHGDLPALPPQLSLGTVS